MLHIGITGGIGSGKSTVAGIFEALGIPVYYADKEAKKLMSEDESLRQAITENFGEHAYVNGELDRGYLASKVFNDTEKLALLNSLVHPATIAAADKWMKAQNAPYVLKEAALIFESESHQHLDFVIGVSSPEELRIRRTMKRDGISREMVQSRMAQQMKKKKKMRLCKYIIINDEQQLILPQVLELHEEFMKR